MTSSSSHSDQLSLIEVETRFTEDGHAFYGDTINDHDIVEVLNSNSSSQSNNTMSNSNPNPHPDTVDDFIALLQAVKAQYGGNVKVRTVSDHANNVEVDSFGCHYRFDDIRIVSESRSLILDNNDEVRTHLVFI